MMKKGIALVVFTLISIFLISLVIPSVSAAGNWSEDLNTSLAAYYTFDENAASTFVFDSTGNNNGTASSNTDVLYNASGKINSAFEFVASNTDSVNTGNLTILTPSELSVSIWFNMKSGGGDSDYDIMVSKNGAQIPFSFYISPTDTLNFYVTNSVGTGKVVESSTGSLKDGAWHHAVAVYNGIDLRLYIDGVLDGTPIAQTGSLLDRPAYDLNIGYSERDSLWCDGTIDEVGIWTKGLSVGEIESLYNNGTGITYGEEIKSIIITIINPTNSSYTTKLINLSSTNSTPITSWWYSLNSGTTNYSFTPNTTFWAGEGSNALIVWGNTSTSILNDSIMFNVTSSSETPIIDITSPANQSYNYSSINLNLNPINLDSYWYTLNGGTDNSTFTPGSSIDWSEGNLTLQVWSNDSDNLIGTDAVNFTVDLPPKIYIVYPENTSYINVDVNAFNYSIVDSSADRCWYSNSSGVNLSTVSAGTNFTGLTSNNGTNNWTVYCNDTVGNVNQSSILFYKVNDTTIPNATLISPANATNSSNTSINFTANLTDDQGIKNATLWVANSSGIFNSTTITYAVGVTQTTVGLVMTLVDGVYQWWYQVFDWVGNERTTNITINTIDDDLLIYYNFNQSSGATIIDVQGNTNATITGTPNWTAGILNNATGYDGTNDYATMTTNGELNNDLISISFWMKNDDAYSTAGSDYYFSSTSNRFHFTMEPSGAGAFVQMGSGGDIIFRFVDLSSGWGDWQHVVMVMNSSGNNKMYLNGDLILTNTTSWTKSDDASMRIMDYIAGSTSEFRPDAAIDEIGIWNRTLSQSEVTELYNSGAAMLYPLEPVGDYLNYTLTVDSTAPQINIVYPVDGTNYTVNLSELNYTTDANDQCWMYIPQNGSLFTDLTNYWKFDESSGVTAIDTRGGETGSQYNITYGASSWRSGVINNSRYHAATNTWGNISESSFLNQSEGTINFWVNKTSSSHSYIIGNLDGDGFVNGSFVLDKKTNGQYRFYITNAVGGSDTITTTTSNNVNGVWKMITIAWNSTGYYVFLNGSRDPGTISYFPIGNSEPMHFGSSGVPPYSIDFIGEMDEFGIWDRSLNDSEIAALYNSGSGFGYTPVNDTTKNLVSPGTNFTGLIPTLGSNNWTVYCNDTVSNLNSSSSIFYWDMVTPNVTLQSPVDYANLTDGDVNFTANFTDDYRLKNATLYVYNSSGDLYNQTTYTFAADTLTNTVGIVVTVIDGVYTWFFQVFDWLGNNANATSRNITVDTTYPQINIVYPQNTTYIATPVTELNYTITEINADVCWYSNSSGVTNSTDVAAGTNFTTENSTEGHNTWTVYCNDTFGQTNSSTVEFTYTEAPFFLTNPPAELSFVRADDTSIDVTQTSQGGVVEVLVGINGTTNYTASMFLNFSENISMQGLLANNSYATTKSFLDNSSGSRIINKSLLIPNVTDGKEVYICSGATNFDTTNISCPGKIALGFGQTKSGMSLTSATYDSQSYYKVLNITGTGGGEGSAPILSLTNNVTPYYGNLVTNFVFNITYTDAENDSAEYVMVVVNKTSYPMGEINATDYNVTDGKRYSMTTNLSSGIHNYTFYAADEAGVSAIGPNASSFVKSNIVITEFSNDLTVENLYFTGDENITRNITIPKNSNFSSAVMNLSGPAPCYQPTANESTSCGGLDTGTYDSPVTWGDGGIPSACSATLLYDDDWDTGCYGSLAGGGVAAYLYVNYTKPANATGALWERKYLTTNVRNNVTIPEACYNQSILELRVTVVRDVISTQNHHCKSAAGWVSLYGITLGTSVPWRFNEESIWWTTDVTNPYIQIDDTQIWNQTGKFNYTIQPNKTNDFASTLNDALNDGACDCTGCSLSGNNCSINFTFHSDDGGILEYSDINFIWNITANTTTFTGPVVDNSSSSIALISPPNNTGTDNQTNNYTVSINDTGGIKNATLNIYNSTGDLVNQTTIDYLAGVTESTLGIVVTLVDGVYTWFYDVFDWVGNFATSGNFTATIDTVIPAINYSTGTEVNNTNISQTYIFVNVTYNDTNAQNVTFSLYNSTSSVNETTINTSSSNSSNLTWTGLPNEAYVYNVTLTDTAGNQNYTSSRTINLDTVAPNTSLMTPTDDLLTSNVTHNYSVSINDTYGIKNATVYISGTSGLVNNTTINYAGGITSIESGLNITLVDGSYTWYYDAYDWAGNLGTTNTYSLRIDSTPPKIEFLDPTAPDYSNLSQDYVYVNITYNDSLADTITYKLYNSSGMINETNVTITYGTCEQNLANVSYGCGDNDTGSYYDVPSPLLIDSNWSSGLISGARWRINYTLPAGLLNGATLKLGARNVGVDQGFTNHSISIPDSCLVSTPLQLISERNTSGLNYNDTIHCLNSTGTEQLWLTSGGGFGSWPPNYVHTGYTTEYAIIWEIANETRTINWTELPDAVYTYNVTMNDSLGNVNTSATRTITLDNANPLLTINVPENTTYTSASRLFNLTVVDTSPMSSCILIQDGTNYTMTINGSEITYTNSSMNDGHYETDYWCNDSVNLVNNTESVNFTIDTSSPIPNITSPSGQIDYHKKNTNLTVNYTITDASLDYCWYDYNGETNISVNCSGTSFDINITNYTSNNLTLYGNDTFGNNGTTSTNWTYKFFEINTSYSNYSYEGDYQTFVLNMSTDNNTKVNLAYLNYNGTSYLATRVEDTSITFTTSLNVPMIGKYNDTFNWNVIYGDSSSNESVNSTYLNNQTIVPIDFVICNTTTNTPYYNFTFKDEVNTSKYLNASTVVATFDYYLNNSLYNKTYTLVNLTGNPSYAYCFTPPNRTAYISNVTYQYSATNYPLREWQNDSQTIPVNYTINQTLWLLSSLDGQYVTFSVSDTTENALEGAEVSVTRVIDGNEVIVGESATDALGRATFFLYQAAPHSIAVTKENCTGSTFTVTPTETSYSIALNCLTGQTIGGNTNIEGVRYSRSPFVGGTTAAGNITFDYYAVSLLYDIIKAKFELYYSNGTLIASNETYVPTSGCNATECYMQLTLYNVTAGADIKARYYIAVNNTDTGEIGYIMLEGDAHWRFITTIASDANTIKSVFTNLRDVFTAWRPAGNDPISGWNFTQLSCEQYQDDATSCKLGGCYWDNSTGNSYGTCYDFNHLNRLEYSRIVFMFLFMAIVLTVFGRLTGYDAQNPGAFLILITGIIALGTFANGITGPGFFYYNNLTPVPFLNNTMLFITVGFFTLGYYLSLTRRYT